MVSGRVHRGGVPVAGAVLTVVDADGGYRVPRVGDVGGRAHLLVVRGAGAVHARMLTGPDGGRHDVDLDRAAAPR